MLPMAKNTPASDPVGLDVMPVVQRKNPGPGRKNNNEARTVNEQRDAEKRSTTTTRQGLPHGGRAKPGGTEQWDQPEPSCTRKLQKGHFQTKVATASQTNEREPCKSTPPGMGATNGENQKSTQINAWMNMSTQEHKQTWSRKGQGSHGPSQKRTIQSGLANPLREKRLESGEKQKLDQHPVAATDRSQATQRQPKTQGTMEQQHRATLDKKHQPTTHDHSHGRRPLVEKESGKREWKKERKRRGKT